MSDAAGCCGSEGSGKSSPTPTSPEDQKPVVSHGPSRRRGKHTKSRGGCKTCKKRKVKCDERRPTCTMCQRFEVPCQYPPQAERIWQQRNALQKHSTRPLPLYPMRLDQDLGQDKDLDLQSLELLHSYTEYTSLTLPPSSVLRGFWRVTVPRLALKHDHLMHSLLALAALHKAHCRPEKREHFVSVALRHHHEASQSARALLENITPDNGTGLFLFSVFTVIIVLNLPKAPSRAGPSDVISLFNEWYWTMQGIRSITETLGDSIREGQLSPLTRYFGRRWRLQQETELPIFPVHEINGMLDELQQRLDFSVCDSENLISYSAFVDRLREAAWTMLSWEDVDMFVWLYRSLDEISALNRFPTQEAMVLWAHLAVIIKFFERQWWLQGWGDHIMSTVYERLDWEHTLWVYRAALEMNWIIPET